MLQLAAPMLSLFKKLFGKTEPKRPTAPAPSHFEPSLPMAAVEVAHLSLSAIIARFSDDLRPLVVRAPESNATVALPVPTIMKQLPHGIVRMSLASLHRQAHGVLGALPPGDKRMVEIPMVEIFRHVKLHALKRRTDQRMAAMPDDGFNLFGDSNNPYALSPTAPSDADAGTNVVDLTDEARNVPARGLKMSDDMRSHFNGGSPAKSQPAKPSQFSKSSVAPAASGVRKPVASAVAAPPPIAAPAPVEPIAADSIDLPLSQLSAAWPEDVRGEIAALDGATTVSLPIAAVTSALARGKVAFPWAQIHAWLTPPAPTSSVADPNIALVLPLKVVAPVFLAASRKPKSERKAVSVDDTIPALFAGSQAAPAPAPVEAAAALPPEPEPMKVVAPPAAVVAETHSAPAVEAAAAAHKIPETVGDVLGQPENAHWSPQELVDGVAKLPGVAGAIVALQEGLQVAQAMPEGIKSDVVAAFLPQIFARLNQYSGEMKLGEVDDLLFTTHGAHCQIYRLGFIYFAVLGKPAESLPWHELRIIADELAKQTIQ